MKIELPTQTVGTALLACESAGAWKFTFETLPGTECGIEKLRIRLAAPAATTPPKFSVEFQVPAIGACHLWSWRNERAAFPPDWGGHVATNIAMGLPVFAFVGQDDGNHIAVACSEAKRTLWSQIGLREEGAELFFRFSFFADPEAPIDSYETTLRIDRRVLHFSEAVRESAAWLDSLPGFGACTPPADAFEPLYSTWYNFQQNVFADTIEAECAEAAKDGMKVIILDDGWQTDDTGRGYGFTGDWEVSKRRFPDMAAHVARVHAMGMKYMVWFAVPFIGVHSKVHDRFLGKFLYTRPDGTADVLDPRFPEVREYLVSVYGKALREWDIDGFKLDFIDSFRIERDPAEADGFAGRDIRSVPEAVDRLLGEIRTRLLAIKPGLLFEFRQNYIGPTIRRYGNMLRATDCPADIFANRSRIANLRLTSGISSVHSDMLEWHPGETVETAAHQVLACLFATIQYSMALHRLPAEHRAMIRHWIRFTTEHREALLRGGFRPHGAASGYPILESWSDAERILAVYDPAVVCEPACDGRTLYLVNATGRASIPVRLAAEPRSVEAFDTCGASVPVPALRAGLQDAAVPDSGYLAIRF